MALRTLYADGGIPRFYRGLLPALVQGPLSRFGDTAANTGILTLLDNLEQTQNMAVGVKTIAASAAAAIFRIGLMPIDTVKTVGFSRVHSSFYFLPSLVIAHITVTMVVSTMQKYSDDASYR